MADNTNTDIQEFWGVQIWDITNPDKPYFTDVNVKHSVKPKFSVIVNEPINQKYPVVIYPSKTDYLTGSATGNFSDNQTDECDIDFTNTQFKLTFVYWLKNHRTKYLKLSDRLIIPIAITDITYDIEDSIDDNFSTNVTFEWVQIGDGTISDSELVKCTNCHSALVPTARYCHRCGQEILASPSITTIS